MTPYTKTLIGQLTSVTAGAFSARLIDDTEGRLPRISTGKDKNPVGQPGSHVAIMQNGIRLLAMVTSIFETGNDAPANPVAKQAMEKSTCMTLAPLGEINEDGEFEHGIRHYPVPGAEVHSVNDEDVETIFMKFRKQGFSVGTLSSNAALDVCLDPDALFGRHFAILGQSGAGKSWCVANLLQRAVRVMPGSHVILLDLHGEYSWLEQDGTRKYAFDEGVARCIDARDLEIPYWVMTFTELVDLLIDRSDDTASSQIAFLRNTVHELRHAENDHLGISHLSIDSPVYFSLKELHACFLQANKATSGFGKEKGPLAGMFDQFIMRLESRMNDARYDFLLQPKLRTSSDTLAHLLRDFVGLGESGCPVTIIDMSTVPFDVRPLVTAQIGRLAFEFNYWNPRHTEFPLLLVCEEAHAYIPRAGKTQYEGAQKSMERIAREGRKYGIGLGVVTQRPHELSETVLSQCNTFICLRLTNPDDQAYVRDLVPEAEQDFVSILSSLGQGESITTGLAVPLPTRLQFHMPEPAPNSCSVDYFEKWGGGHEEPDVDDIVDRWRRQHRLQD